MGRMVFVNRLDELAARAVLASATFRNKAIVDLRDYIQKVNINQLIAEIQSITSPAELRFIQAAGVPGGAMQTFINQIEKASGR